MANLAGKAIFPAVNLHGAQSTGQVPLNDKVAKHMLQNIHVSLVRYLIWQVLEFELQVFTGTYG